MRGEIKATKEQIAIAKETLEDLKRLRASYKRMERALLAPSNMSEIYAEIDNEERKNRAFIREYEHDAE